MLRALGMTAAERRVVAILRVGAVAVGATILTVVGGVWFGPVAITGLARQAEPSPQAWFDAPVVAAVAVAMLALVLGAAVLGSARRPARPRRDASALERALVAVRLPVDLAMGARRALATEVQGGSGRAALVGVVAGVVAMVGVLTFSSSIDRLLRSPEQWGAVFDVVVVPGSTPAAYEEAIEVLGADDEVDAVSLAADTALTLTLPDGELFTVPVNHAMPMKGALAPYLVVDGDDLRTDDEALVGQAVLDRMHLAIGDDLVLETPTGTHELAIAGRVVAYDVDRIDYGIVVTPRAVEALGLEDDENSTSLLVRFDEGIDPAAATARLAERFEHVAPAGAPSTIDNLDELGLLPGVLALAVAALGCGAIAYGLASSVRRSRRELATVRAIGASRAMLVRSVLAQAGVLVVVGLAVGIPLGITAGRSAFLVVARSTGAIGVLEVPTARIALVAAVALVLALLLGIPPAARVARTRAATFLRVD